MSDIEQYINKCKDKMLNLRLTNQKIKKIRIIYNINKEKLFNELNKFRKNYNQIIKINNDYPIIIKKIIMQLNANYCMNQCSKLYDNENMNTRHILGLVTENLKNANVYKPKNFNNGYAKITDITTYFIFLIQTFSLRTDFDNNIINVLKTINMVLPDYNIEDKYDNKVIKKKYNSSECHLLAKLFINLNGYISHILYKQDKWLYKETEIKSLNIDSFITNNNIPAEILSNTELKPIIDKINLQIQFNLNEQLVDHVCEQFRKLVIHNIADDIIDHNPFRKLYYYFDRPCYLKKSLCITIINYKNYSYLNNLGKQLYEYIINRVKNNDFNKDFNISMITGIHPVNLVLTNIYITQILRAIDDKNVVKSILMYNLPTYNLSSKTKKLLFKYNLITPEEYAEVTATEIKESYSKNNIHTEPNIENDDTQVYWILTGDFELYKVNPNIEIYSNLEFLTRIMDTKKK